MAIPSSNIKMSDLATEVYGSVGTNRKLSSLIASSLNISGPPYKWSEYTGYIQPTLSISPTALSFDTDGFPCSGSQDNFTITTAFPSQAWSLTDDMTWFSEDIMSGTGTTVITLTCTPHATGGTRSGTITISSPEVANKTVAIQQFDTTC
jgi:hypothetical protein